MTIERDHDRERVDTSHLDGVEDGCGCAEVWEHLSAGREDETDTEADSEVDSETSTENDPTVDAEGETVPADAGET